MALYYCYQCKRSLSVKGTFYLSFDISDGKERLSVTWFVDKDPSTYSRKFLKMQISKKGEFYNVISVDSIVDGSQIPVDSPLNNLEITSKVSISEVLNLIGDLRKDLSPAYKEFLSKSRLYALFEQYSKYPAGLSVHHDIQGGLLQHVFEMLQGLKSFMTIPYLSNVQWGQCIIAIIYHDYGKLVEYDQESWDITPEYPLLGHIYISANFVNNGLIIHNNDGQNPFTKREIECIVHCILAHHMNKEWGSPVVPATMEATIVHYLDMLSARAYVFSHTQDMQANKWIGTTVIKNTI